MGDDPQESYREWLVEAHHQASKDFDKAVMTLSGGALGLSLTFIKQIAHKPTRSIGWLTWSWALFAFSLLAILFSFVASQAAIKKAIKNMDRDAEHAKEGLAGTTTLVLNSLAAVTLVAGVCCLTAFAVFNERM